MGFSAKKTVGNQETESEGQIPVTSKSCQSQGDPERTSYCVTDNSFAGRHF